MNQWLSGRVPVLQFVVAGSISSGGYHTIHSWWGLIKSKQLTSVPVCHTGFLGKVIQFIIYIWFAGELFVGNFFNEIELISLLSCMILSFGNHLFNCLCFMAFGLFNSKSYIYIYIYIYIYLLTYFLPAFTVTRKKEKKKTPGTRDNNISNYRPREKEKKYHRTKKKEKANFVILVEKNQEICNQLVKRKIKTHRKLLQCYNYQECSIQSRTNYKN